MIRLKKIHRGATLIEVIFGLIIIAGATTALWKYQNQQAEDTLNAATAQYQNVLVNASQKYISDNYDAVLAIATPTTPAIITVQMLKTSKYLPASFGNVSPRGQTYQLYAIEPSAKKLESLLVSSGGAAINDGSLVRIANKAGASAGYITSTAPGTVKGVYGSWSTSLSNYNIGNNAGHLAAALFFTDGQLDNDYLYRSAVAGHPEVNRMNTAINMNSNDLNNVNTANTATLNSNIANATTLNSSTANATTMNSTTTNTNGETYTGGWFRTTGDGGVYFSKYGGGWYMGNTSTISVYGNKNVQTGGGLYGGYVNSTGNIDASGNMFANGSMSANGNVTANGTVVGGSVYSRSNIQADGSVTANGNVMANGYLYTGLIAGEGNGCSPNGAQARDGAGGPLWCENGIWSKPKSGKPGYYCRYTSMSKGKSEDYVGYTPRTDRNCPVISPGQIQGECACMKIILDY